MPGVAVLIAGDEANDLHKTLDAVRKALATIGQPGRIVVCADDVDPASAEIDVTSFAGAVQDALKQTTEAFVFTIAAREPDPTDRIVALWGERDHADVVIAAFSSLDRGTRPKDFGAEFDRLANRLTARFLTLDVLDPRSMTRLYKRAVIDDLVVAGTDFHDAIGQLVSATVRGWKIREIERPYWPARDEGPPIARPSFRSLGRYWKDRNGIHDADYDMRAFNSRIFVQRKWQQKRQELTMDLVRPYRDSRILNVGCGSARLNLDLPGAFGVDVVQPKLRYLSRYGVNHLAAASVFDLPFHDGAFDCVVCAEVIEHIPREGAPVRELARVLGRGGRLVISTPDYGSSIWPTIEKLYGWVQPSGYADQHVTHYDESALVQELATYDMACVEMRRLYGAILIGAFEKSS